MSQNAKRIKNHIDFIYGEERSFEIFSMVIQKLSEYEKEIKKVAPDHSPWSESDVLLITYGDSILSREENPLSSLNRFLSKHLKNSISTVHLLPFFPFSSDDGFSVINYKRVNYSLGNWDDISRIGKNFGLMYDLVLNHGSSRSDWFRQFLNGEEPGKDYYHAFENPEEVDISKVVRPRSSLLLTPFITKTGKKFVWTTFSADQVDFDFSNPQVLLEFIDIFLPYVASGANIVRLDAIALLWKVSGEDSIHHEKTHEVVKLLRSISDYIESGCLVLTETNVPHKENISYFGASDEAHIVYQFSLAPLLLHAMLSQDSRYLAKWASGLKGLPEGCTYLNFTASHDGIGMRPAEGVIPDLEVDRMITSLRNFGAEVSTRKLSDGSEKPYEVNITYFDSLKGTFAGLDKYQVKRFVCAQCIMISLQGIPAFYIHSLTATKNYYSGVERTGRARTINRYQWDYDRLRDSLGNPESHHHEVFYALKKLSQVRRRISSFHPDAEQEILDLGHKIFALKRGSEKTKNLLLSPHNISRDKQVIKRAQLPDFFVSKKLKDLISGEGISSGSEKIEFKAYQSMWLLAEDI